MFLTICVLYKSPQCTLGELKYHMFSISKLKMYSNLILVGDFNIDVSKPGSTMFLEFMAENFPKARQIVNNFTTNDNTLIDLCFTTFPSASSQVVNFLWSHHDTVCITVWYAHLFLASRICIIMWYKFCSLPTLVNVLLWFYFCSKTTCFVCVLGMIVSFLSNLCLCKISNIYPTAVW